MAEVKGTFGGKRIWVGGLPTQHQGQVGKKSTLFFNFCNVQTLL